MSCPECVKREASEAAQRSLKAGRRGAPEPQVIKARREGCLRCPHATIVFGDRLGWANFSTCQLCQCNIAEKTKHGPAVCPDTPARWLAVQGS